MKTEILSFCSLYLCSYFTKRDCNWGIRGLVFSILTLYSEITDSNSGRRTYTCTYSIYKTQAWLEELKGFFVLCLWGNVSNIFEVFAVQLCPNSSLKHVGFDSRHVGSVYSGVPRVAKLNMPKYIFFTLNVGKSFLIPFTLVILE